MTFEQAWRGRYGSEPPAEFAEIESLMGHRSVRRFGEREVPEDMMRAVFACAQAAATSSHLQLWSAISVHDREKRVALQEVAANYRYVGDAPWFFVFLADHYRLRKSVEAGADALDYTEYFAMSAIDAALAAERMVCAAEMLGLGTCYIGAIRNDPERVAQILDLPEGTFPLFGVCLGWNAEPDGPVKPRLSQDAVWFRDRYDRDAGVSEFDERMRGYYERTGQNTAITWSQRSARRTDEANVSGRDVLLEFLRRQGFCRR
jgi:nitroreductase